MVVANKCESKAKKAVPTEEGKAFADSIGAQFCEASAMEGVNVQEGFALLAKEIMTRSASAPSGSKSNDKKPTNQKMRAAQRLTNRVKNEKKSKCC